MRNAGARKVMKSDGRTCPGWILISCVGLPLLFGGIISTPAGAVFYRTSLFRLSLGACLVFLTLPLSSSTPSTAGRLRLDSELESFREEGNGAFFKGLFETAARSYASGLSAAIRKDEPSYAARFANNLANVDMIRFRYQDALNGYLRARSYAERAGPHAKLASVDLSLAVLYVILGELDYASQSVDRGLTRPDASTAYHQLLACRAQIRARQNRYGEATADFENAMKRAHQLGDPNDEANYSDALGDQMVVQKQYLAARERFDASLKLRSSAKLSGVRLSYLRLASLSLEEGKFAEADENMDRASRVSDNDLGVHPWLILSLRARLLHGKGENASALTEFRKALRACRDWQREAAPAGIAGPDAQKLLDGVYRELVDVSLQVDPSLAVDAFEATEEDRAAALSQMLTASDHFRKSAPPEYWATVAALRDAQTREFSGADPSARRKVEQARLALREWEAKIGRKEINVAPSNLLENNTTSTTLRRIQEGLRPDEALLSFHAGRDWSGLWAVTKTSVELHRLPAEKELAEDIRLFRRQVEKSLEGRDAHGETLYRRLLGGIGQPVRNRPVWVITADDSFFEVPFAALVAEWKQGKPVYLLEQHTILHTPSAMMLASSPNPAPPGPFLGVGDGIYNSADDRWRAEKTGWTAKLAFWSKPTPTLQMVRLPGSGREIASCARTWNKVQPADSPPPMLLTGAGASRSSLTEAIGRHPSVIHVASHFLTTPGLSGRALIDLGMNPSGQPEVLHERDIMALNTPGALIAMSGCNSAGSAAVPTAGVLGLTRAWLIAGARAVVGSRWPTPDDTGVMFNSFYGHLGPRVSQPARLRASALALREAQLDMLRSNSWRSEPRYWSAFYVLGKE